MNLVEKERERPRFAETLFIAFGPDGAVCITDTDNFRIQKFDETGRFIFDIQMEAESEFRFINPTDIVVDANNVIYVMDWMFTEISNATPHAPPTTQNLQLRAVHP